MLGANLINKKTLMKKLWKNMEEKLQYLTYICVKGLKKYLEFSQIMLDRHVYGMVPKYFFLNYFSSSY